MLEWLLTGLAVVFAGLVGWVLAGLLGLSARRWAPWGLGALAAGGLSYGVIQAQQWAWDIRGAAAIDAAIPRVVDEQGFVGADACRACHPGEYASWHGSFHRTMTQRASTESIVAPFDGRDLVKYGLTSRPERRGDEFWIDMEDPAYLLQAMYRNAPQRPGVAPRVQRQIVMTTGSHHFQAYWFRDPESGDLWQFPWRYSIDDQRWVHRDDSFLAPPERDEMRGHRVWNEACIECHAVAGQPGQTTQLGASDDTRVADLGIACEACHGPAEEHVRRHRNPVERYQAHLDPSDDPTIVHPGHLSPRLSAQVCGGCHGFFEYTHPQIVADRWKTGRELRPGTDFEQVARYLTVEDQSTYGAGPESIEVAMFWSDGACRTAGREYNGLVESPCHVQGGMTCLDCHSLHSYDDPSDQLHELVESNDACLACHDEYRDRLAEHTRHAPDGAGSLCYNCHMPYSSFGLLGAIRSHRVDIPQPAAFGENVRLNACNLCHLDQTLDWTDEHLAARTGRPRNAYSDDERTLSAGVLWLLQGDAGQRANVAWACGWEAARDAAGADWQPPLLAALFDDPYSAVRYNAFRSLARLPGFENLPNDYDAEPLQRQQARNAVQAQWLANPDAATAVPANALPSTTPSPTLSTRSPIDAATFRRLLEKRNNRRMVNVE
jgi:hypothetical protein